MDVKYVSIGISLLILLFVIELIRREKLTFQYALSWLVASTLALGLSIFDRLLFGISDFFGFALPSNFIFFILLAAFVFISLLMTLFLCQQSRRNETIAQKIAVLEFQLQQLQKKDNDKDT
jgi:hypothetical protein